MKSSWLVGLFAFVIAFAGVTFAVEKKIAVDKLKCLLADKPAVADKSSDWKDGKVFFCCGGCLKKFDADKSGKKEFAAKANHQLIASMQVEQKACPYSGAEIKKDVSIEFKGATMGFCCNGCKGKAEKLSDDEKLATLFGEEFYEKAKFAKVEDK